MGQRKLSASELFHMKLQNESLRIPLIPPRGYLHLFRDCRCLKFFHHKQSNSYILLLEKYENVNISKKLLLKLKINFITTEIEHISFGIIDENNDYYSSEIVGYDYNRSLLIVDTLYEPLCPLNCNALNNMYKNMTMSPHSSTNIYDQYNKCFTFATKKRQKKQVITKKFAAFGLNEFVSSWKIILIQRKRNTIIYIVNNHRVFVWYDNVCFSDYFLFFIVCFFLCVFIATNSAIKIKHC